MLPYCLTHKKNIEKLQFQEFYKLVMVKQCYYQNMLCVILKNQDL